MKKLSAVVLAALIVLSCTASAFAAVTGARYIVDADFARVFDKPSSDAGFLFEVPGNTYVRIVTDENDSVKEENGFLLADVPSQGTGWIFAADLARAEADSDTDIADIYIASYPDKTEYVETEESFDPAGLTVKARLKNGGERTLTGYSIFTESFNSVGTKKVTVLYRPENYAKYFTVSFTVGTVRIPVVSLDADISNMKTSYIENTPLDLAGIKLKATYSDGRADAYFTATDIINNKSFTVTVDNGKTDAAKLTDGTHTVTVAYRYSDISYSFDIGVRKKTLVSLIITTEPNSLTVYSLDEIPSLEGLTLVAGYDNGETQTLTAADCAVSCELPLHYGSGNIVTVSYGELARTLDFTARPLEEKRLKLTLPQVLTFILGEEIDLSGLKVEIEYTDGSVKEVTDYKMSDIEPLNTEKLGQDVVVTSGMFSETFTIFIIPNYQRGDIDGDGEVTVKDARYALRQAVGLIELTVNSKPYTAADADKDGSVSVRDARLILRGAVGLEKLPLALYEHG